MDFQVQILVDNVIAKSGFKILHPNNDVRIANHISSTLKRIAKAASRRMIANSAWTTATVNRPLRRSEEHTSELQSLMRSSYAVFCLKKKTAYTRPTHRSTTSTEQPPTTSAPKRSDIPITPL